MYELRTLRRASVEIRHHLEFLSGRSKRGAEAWARALDKTFLRLKESVHAFPLAAEDAHVTFAVQEALFKTRRGLIYRILFTIAGGQVLILSVRGPGQDFLTKNDF
ncbi:hypothetical protein Pan189_26410 [Stratiformator vulcanicus]|uniref:Plasmid stabilization system protein n=1 Tax=Stratiformator vulcanicus TaxID=2527980 RepID=A0A517R316_9PLAN|nr:hypothetical protein Pan189_26410 [Stratiformator vulcanicus]